VSVGSLKLKVIRWPGVDDVEKYCPDALWHLAKPLLPPHPERHQGGGRSRSDDRATLAAILYVLESGCSWRKLPASDTAPNTYRSPQAHVARNECSPEGRQPGTLGDRRRTGTRTAPSSRLNSARVRPASIAHTSLSRKAHPLKPDATTTRANLMIRCPHAGLYRAMAGCSAEDRDLRGATMRRRPAWTVRGERFAADQ
jgi:transposase